MIYDVFMPKPLLEIHWKAGHALRDYKSFYFDGTSWTEAAQVNPPSHPQALGTVPARVIGTGRQGLYKILRQWLALYGKNKGETIGIGAFGYQLDSRLPGLTLKHLGDEFFYVTFRKGEPVKTTCLKEVMDLVEKTFPDKAPHLLRKRPSSPSPT